MLLWVGGGVEAATGCPTALGLLGSGDRWRSRNTRFTLHLLIYLNLLGWGFFCIWRFVSPRFIAFLDCFCSRHVRLHPRLCGIASEMFLPAFVQGHLHPNVNVTFTVFCHAGHQSLSWTLIDDLPIVGVLADQFLPLPFFFCLASV